MLTKKFQTVKEGTAPQKKSSNIRAVLPITAKTFLNNFLHVFQNEMLSASMYGLLFQTGLSERQEGFPEDRINLYRQHTHSFKHPANKKYYISLVTEPFSSLLGDWVGRIHICFLLWEKSLNESLQSLC